MPVKPKTSVAVSSTGHPAAFKKIRCPHCQGYASADPHNDNLFRCSRCGKSFKNTKF